MLTAKYPIKDTSDFITVNIDAPETMPTGEKRATWSISAPGFEKRDHSCGIDDLQCLLLSMKCLIRTMEEWEEGSGNKCEYTFYQDMKIVYDPQYMKEKRPE
jgi:hypothetical protein